MRRKRPLIAEELNGETLLADPDAARFQSLNSSGTILWDLLERQATLDDLASALVARYAIDRERALVDARAFVEELVRRGLAEITHG
jgi:Coenzyme PQQ synthesis protein D (PqqD)